MFDVSKYTIGWVCAILPELVAARLHLDTEHDASEYEAQPNDDNTYAFGTIGKHNVIVAALPTGEYGISSAARVARDMIRSFPNLRIGLMVGIAGGAPLMQRNDRKKQDIRLGDVVVGIPGNRQGGVYQYTYGKAIQGQSFVPTGHLNSPPSSVLTALNMLRADFVMFGNNIDKDVGARLSQLPQPLEEYLRPPPESDRLYTSSFIHQNNDESCFEACKDDSMLVERLVRDSKRDQVLIHYGLIASADQLMKDAEMRDAFAREAGVLCFEMEAAGLMNQFPFLVVRGICDYADSHKNKDWQEYAAMTAAAFTRKLLLRLMPSKVEAEGKLGDVKEIKEGMKHIANQVDNIVKTVEQHSTTALQHEIENWLAAPDQSTNHNEALELRHEDSGTWVLHTNTFREWQSLKFPLMWVYGISGCGKTVLTSTIIENLRGTDDTLLYFYFDVQDQRKQKLDHALRSFVKQLARTDIECHIEQLYRSCSEGGLSQPTLSQLRHCLAELIKDRPTIFVLDALDECSDLDEVLTWIKSVASKSSHIRFIITSRPEQEIKAALTSWVSCDATLEVTGDLFAQDIKTFVHSRIYDSKDELRRWKTRPKIQHDIETNLIQKADGMFRWVACQLDVLRKCVDPLSLEKALKSLPIGLYATYDRILLNMSETQRDSAIRILQFLAYSDRPFSLEELVDAVAVRPDQNPAFHEEYRMPDPEEVAWCCSSLTRVVKRKIPPWYQPSPTYEYRNTIVQEVQLAHASVKEYLLSDQSNKSFSNIFQENRAAACMTTVSLAYLHEASRRFKTVSLGTQPSTGVVAQTHLQNRAGFEKQAEELPFRDLAASTAQRWMGHVESAENDGHPALGWIYQLLTEDKFYKCWMTCIDETYRIEVTQWPNPLFHTALRGMETTTRRLLEDGIDVNACDQRYGPALHAASYEGHIGIVKLLIDKGANVNAQGGQRFGRESALGLAATNGHLEVAKVLLNKGSNINIQKGTIGNPIPALTKASINGSLDVVTLLLERGANVNAGHKHETALCVASTRGDFAIAELLINRGAAVNTSYNRPKPLLAAVASGHCELVKLLLSRGADVHAKEGAHEIDALWAASRGGHLEAASLLLRAGARADGSGSTIGSALHVASHNNHRDIIRLLISNGADLNAEKEDALQQAAEQGHLESVKLLLDLGAQIDRQVNGKDALYVASDSDRFDVVKLLLDRGAKVNRQADGKDALYAASRWGHFDVVKLLLERGARIVANIDDGKCENALTAASERGNTNIVKLLLEKEMKTIVEEDLHSNALVSAVDNNHLSVVHLLLNAGANVDTRMSRSNFTALHVAAKKGEFDMVQLLLEYGADVNATAGLNNDIYPIKLTVASDAHVRQLLRKHGASAIDDNDDDYHDNDDDDGGDVDDDDVVDEQAFSPAVKAITRSISA